MNRTLLPSTSLDYLIRTAAASGLSALSPTDKDELIECVAERVERDLDLAPCINPHRRYRLGELERYGYKRGRLYAAYKSIIKKDGRTSYITGADLLKLVETAPTLAGAPAPTPPVRRLRGRPRKNAPPALDTNNQHS